MEKGTRQRILELGMTAPSVDNSQPFYFGWEGSQLLVYRDEGRDRRRGNVGNYVSMVGLGCLAECLTVAASGEGLSAEIDFTYENGHSNGPWLVISFRPDRAAPDEILVGLKSRCSDRRLYQGGELSDLVFQQTMADVARFDDCSLYYKDPADRELLDYIKECEKFLWQDKRMLPEMLSWVRWSRKETLETRDGMPWESMGVSFLVSRLMMLISRSERFRQLARRSGGPLRSQQRTIEAHVRSSAALGCIAVDDTRPQTMFQLGRVFLRTWVRLNMAGYGLQVMANPALHAFQHVAGILPEDYPTESKRVFADGHRILSEAFECQEGQIPAWMFRTGKSSPLPSDMKTLRLPESRYVR
jgi:hypothetical protein